MDKRTKIVRRRGEAGNALVLFALMLPVLLGFAALAVDVGYLYFVRTAMQATADA
ncbi:MAG: pilus assembly protein TadG-related protein, partial [Nitrospinota bacterium]